MRVALTIASAENEEILDLPFGSWFIRPLICMAKDAD